MVEIARVPHSSGKESSTRVTRIPASWVSRWSLRTSSNLLLLSTPPKFQRAFLFYTALWWHLAAGKHSSVSSTAAVVWLMYHSSHLDEKLDSSFNPKTSQSSSSSPIRNNVPSQAKCDLVTPAPILLPRLAGGSIEGAPADGSP